MSWPSTFNTINEQIQAKDRLSALVVTQILQVRFNIKVSLKNCSANAEKTWLEDRSGKD